jgi:hypothetical protein
MFGAFGAFGVFGAGVRPPVDDDPALPETTLDVRVVDDEVLDSRVVPPRVVEVVVEVEVEVEVVDGEEGAETGGCAARTTVESRGAPVGPAPPKTRT